MAVEVLVSSKLRRSDAGRYVADQARKLGLRQPNGKQIDSRTVLGWRDDIEVSKSLVGGEVFRRLKAKRANGEPVTDQTKAKALALEYLKEVRLAGFLLSNG